MHVIVNALALKHALKRLQPARRYKSMQEPTVMATAGGSALVLVGTLESSASVEAVVHNAGSAHIPLNMAIRLLGTYKKGSALTVRAEPDAVFFDNLRFTIR